MHSTHDFTPVAKYSVSLLAKEATVK